MDYTIDDGKKGGHIRGVINVIDSLQLFLLVFFWRQIQETGLVSGDSLMVFLLFLTERFVVERRRRNPTLNRRMLKKKKKEFQVDDQNEILRQKGDFVCSITHKVGRAVKKIFRVF